jgi:hypothetical protein
VNDYIEQLIMMNDENGVAGASGTGPSAGYTFVFLFLFTGFLVWLTRNKMEYMYVITILLLYSWIKFNNNLPNFSNSIQVSTASSIPHQHSWPRSPWCMWCWFRIVVSPISTTKRTEV